MDVTDVRQRLQERVVPLALGQHSLQVQAEHVSTQLHLWALQRHAGLGLGQEAFEAFVANEKVALGDVEGEELAIDGVGDDGNEREDDGRRMR